MNSDLDVVVVADVDGHRRVPMSHGGWTVEVRVFSEDGMRSLWQREIGARWCPVLRMCAEGVVVVDSRGVGARLQREAQGLIAAGSATVSAGEATWRGDRVDGLVADLVDLADGLDQSLVGAALITEIAELLSVLNCGWIDHGKWLGRRLREASPTDANALEEAAAAWARGGQPAELVALGADVVARARRFAKSA